MESLSQYIEKRKGLFWSVGEDQLDRISKTLLVETILNYGTAEDVRELFNVVGLKEVANVFFKSIENRKRDNYFPQTKNFFTLYFNRHVRQHIV